MKQYSEFDLIPERDRCDAIHPELPYYTCSLQKQHAGEHVARMNHYLNVLAVWEQVTPDREEKFRYITGPDDEVHDGGESIRSDLPVNNETISKVPYPFWRDAKTNPPPF